MSTTQPVYIEEGFEEVKGWTQAIPFYWEKKNETAKVMEIFDSKIAQYLQAYPNYEVSTFETQRDEAEKFLKLGESKYLEAILGAKNAARKAAGLDPLTMKQLVEKIIEKSTEFITVYAPLLSWKEGEMLRIKEKYAL